MATNSPDLFFSPSADKLGSEDEGLIGEVSASQNFVIALQKRKPESANVDFAFFPPFSLPHTLRIWKTYSSQSIYNYSLVGLVLIRLPVLFGDQSPQAINVDCGAVFNVLLEMEVPHTNLTEITRMAR